MNLEKSSVDQAKDTGLALALILLLIAYFKEKNSLLLFPAVVLILVMTRPNVFRPLSRVWFGLSDLMGKIVSNIILTIIFMLIITPFGLIRRIFGNDPMRQRSWKKGPGSVFLKRDHDFKAGDLEKPY